MDKFANYTVADIREILLKGFFFFYFEGANFLSLSDFLIKKSLFLSLSRQIIVKKVANQH
jgi:hypothetical protein